MEVMMPAKTAWSISVQANIHFANLVWEWMMSVSEAAGGFTVISGSNCKHFCAQRLWVLRWGWNCALINYVVKVCSQSEFAQYVHVVQLLLAQQSLPIRIMKIRYAGTVIFFSFDNWELEDALLGVLGSWCIGRCLSTRGSLNAKEMDEGTPLSDTFRALPLMSRKREVLLFGSLWQEWDLISHHE